MQADVGVAHFAVQFSLGHQRGDRIDHQYVDGARADEGLGDFEGLLAAVGLRNEQVVDIDTQFSRIGGVQGMLGIDKGS